MPLGNLLPNTIQCLEQVSRESSEDILFLGLEAKVRLHGNQRMVIISTPLREGYIRDWSTQS